MKFSLATKLYLLLFVCGILAVFVSPVQAAFNPMINYQGKLTDDAGVTVANGTYNMRFWLLTSPSIATTSAVWTESLTSTNKVQVTNGLFSVMLGSTSAMTSVDFNRTLYLGVEIGGTGAASWDGEMSPRKILGAVPAAFEAKNSQTFAGIATTSFLRSDQPDTIAASSASTLLTITQSGVGDILNIFDGATEVFTITDGGLVGVGSTSPIAEFSVGGDFALAGGFYDYSSSRGNNGEILLTTGATVLWTATSSLGLLGNSQLDTCAEFAAIMSGETGTCGSLVLSDSPTFTTQITTPLIQIDTNATGVSLDTDGDGMLIIAGTGNGNDEDLRFNFDDAGGGANFIDVTSGTGATTLNFSSIALQESGIAVLNNDEIDASSELSAIMDDETGSGRLVFSGSPAFSGTATFSALTATGTATFSTVDINGGAIDGSTIGAASASTIIGTTIQANTGFLPDTDGGAYLGQATQAFSGLFLDTGTTINFDNGNSVITHSSGILTVSTGDLRVTTAGTNAASVVTVGGTQTLTNKTFTSPTLSSTTISGILKLSSQTASRGLFTDAQSRATTTALSATLVSSITDETGSGLLVFDTAPTFTTQITTPLIQIDTNATGVSLDTDGDGMLIIAGTGNGSDEDLRINLDDTADTAVFTSATGLATINFSSIALQESGSAVLSVGDLDSCAEFAALGVIETGTCGSLVLSADPTFTGTVNAAALTLSSTLTLSGSAANIALGSNYLSGDGQDEGIYVTSTGRVGIGTTTPNQMLTVFASGADAAIEFSTVTGANEKWTIGIDDSDGTKFKISSSSALGSNDRLVIDGAGRVGIGTSSPVAMLQVGSSRPVTYSWYNTFHTLFTEEKLVPGSDDDHATLMADLTLNSAGATNELNAAMVSGVNIKSGNAQNFGSTIGLMSTASHGGSGTVSALWGITGQGVNASNGTVTSLVGVIGELYNTGGGTVASAYGLRVADISNTSGTLTNTYGLYIGDVTAGTQTNQAYGLYSGDANARNYFGGKVGIGTTTPNQLLSIFASGADAAIEFSTVTGANEKWTLGIDDSDGTKFKISSSSALGTNDRLVIDGAGRVGIGTSTPQSDLSIAGTGNLSIYDATGGPSISLKSGSAGVDAINGTLSFNGSDGTAMSMSLDRRTCCNPGMNFWTYVDGQYDNVFSIGLNRSVNLNRYPGTAYPGSVWMRSGSTSAAFLTVDGGGSSGAGVKGLVVQGASSQTANLQEWQNSSASVLAAVSSAGYFGIGTSSPVSHLVVRSSGTTDILNLVETGGVEVFTVLESGRVGIGSTTPSQELSVAGDVSITGRIYDSLNSAGSNGMVLQSTGSAFNWVATSTLGITGGSGLASADIDTCAEFAAIMGGETGTCGSLVLSISPSITGTLDVEASDFSGTMTLSGSAANIALGSNYLSGDGQDEGIYVTSTGKIGIGTTTPNQMLTVFASGADAAIEFSTVTGSKEKWTIGIDDSDGTKFKISSSSALGTNDRLVIDGSGYVGIGDTSPASLLTVGSGDLFQVNSSGAIAAVVGITSSAAVTINDNDGVDSETMLTIGDSNDWDNAIVYGSISIGEPTGAASDFFNTNAPLIVRKSSKPHILLEDNASAVGGFAMSSSGLTLGTETGFIEFRTGVTYNGDYTTTGSQRMVLNSSGDVGIGTSTPNKRLNVFETAADAQLRLSYDSTRYADFQVDSSGDMLLHASGNDVYLTDDNLRVCSSGACPSVTASSTGNVVVENLYYFGNGFSMGRVAASTTQIGIYNTAGTAIIYFE